MPRPKLLTPPFSIQSNEGEGNDKVLYAVELRNGRDLLVVEIFDGKDDAGDFKEQLSPLRNNPCRVFYLPYN